jgi:hypothetical protein
MRSGSTDWYPAIVFTRTGKKVMTAVMKTLPSRPKPNHTTIKGARATFGSD